MNKNNLSIATITWARDSEEEVLLRASLQHLATLDIPVFITDGGSSKSFLDFLNSFANFHLVQANAKGVFAQVKSSLAEAYKSGSPFIIYTEPDKGEFFKNGLPAMLNTISLGEWTGVITASRSAEGFATFPEFQQMTETTINNCCTEVVKIAGDYTYGPFVLNRLLVPYLDLVKADIGWGWRPYVFSIAKRLGYTLEAFTGDFTCPVLQRNDNEKERIYRMRQLSQNIEGITLSTTVSLGQLT